MDTRVRWPAHELQNKSTRDCFAWQVIIFYLFPLAITKLQLGLNWDIPKSRTPAFIQAHSSSVFGIHQRPFPQLPGLQNAVIRNAMHSA
jgi:hypothetical protein